nr:tryptoPK1 [Locusta migratoria]
MPRGAQLFLLLALVTAARVLDARAESSRPGSDAQSSHQDGRGAAHDRNDESNELNDENRSDGDAQDATFRRGREVQEFGSHVAGPIGSGEEDPWLTLADGSYIPAEAVRELVQRGSTLSENTGVWFGPRYGRRTSCGENVPLKWLSQVEKRAAKQPALWFGPRVGRSLDEEPKGEEWRDDDKGLKGGSSQRQDRSAQPPGLWFGPRVGRRSDAQVDDMLWFGPRPGRSVDTDKQDLYDDEVAMRDQRGAKHPGLWFGPRFGR